eukprot:PLAT12192.1.p1 GENE.PLAT12192.1~~PLAT12192.1.p1  ORF type:complete len:350 (-),score=118.83 PLAT12192.1:51-1064(-)
MAQLGRIAAALGKRVPRTLPDGKRSAIALILRVLPDGAGEEGELTAAAAGAAAEQALLPLEQLLRSDDEHVQLLLLKRADNPRDSWSGHVAFPGGRRDESDADDYETAVRETLEETGIDLTSNFYYLGRLDDRLATRNRSATLPSAMRLVVCPHVFLQASAESPELCLAEREISHALWAPLSRFSPDHVQRGIDLHMPGLFRTPVKMKARTLSHLGLDVVNFPSIGLPLPEHLEEEERKQLMKEMHPTKGHPAFRLWGLSLRATSDLMALAGVKRLDWPPMLTRNLTVNTLIKARCGWKELFHADRLGRMHSRQLATTLGLLAVTGSSGLVSIASML